jgi:hypothetical protein
MLGQLYQNEIYSKTYSTMQNTGLNIVEICQAVWGQAYNIGISLQTDPFTLFLQIRKKLRRTV